MARTSKTGKAKAVATSKAEIKQTAAAAEAPKAPPSQQIALTNKDVEQLKTYLDKHDRPFETIIVPKAEAESGSNPKKRKWTAATLQDQGDLFDERLDVRYDIKPRDKWDCLRKYKKFTVGEESIAVGMCVLVKHDDSEGAQIDPGSQWKAKVLEVRALDTEHVYLRIAWINRPEDLPSGRKPYHGENELIPTNQLDVIDAMSVNGSITVEHWDEKDDDSEHPGEDRFFWRQTYDYANTKTLTELRQICIDEAPQNPDEMIFQCGDLEECGRWLHVKCVAESAVQDANKHASTKKAKKSKPKLITIDPSSAALAKAELNSITAEVFIKDLPRDDELATPSDKTEIIITTADGETESKSLSCLFCHTPIA